MKIQCELCKEIVPIGRFDSSRAGIEVTCEACGESFFVPGSPDSDSGSGSGSGTGSGSGSGSGSSSGSSTGTGSGSGSGSSTGTGTGSGSGSGSGSGEMRCPKCDQEQPRADACCGCGLRAELFEAYAREQSENAPAELEALWEECERDWDDGEPHERFAQATSAAYAFAYAARRYRGVLRRRPNDVIAHRQLDRLSRMAEATLLSTSPTRKASSEGEQPYKNLIIMLIVLVLLAGVGGIYLLFKQAKAVDSETRQKTPTTLPAKR